MAWLVRLGARLLLGGKSLFGALGRALAWLLEEPARLIVAVLAAALAWQSLVTVPRLRRDRAAIRYELTVSERAGLILAGRVVAEKAAHRQTKADYRKAQADAAQREADRLERVRAEQQEITDEVAEDFRRRLADARARAGQLRDQAGARAGERAAGASGDEQVSTAGNATSGVDEAPCEDGLSLSERLTATEQAIQLDSLISFVERQGTIDVNRGASE